MEGRRDGWMDGWMGGWTKEGTNRMNSDATCREIR